MCDKVALRIQSWVLFKLKQVSLTLAAQVTALLKAEILSGSLRPGQVLLPKDISERLGISRVPVRESLQHLAAMGLVQQKPNKSAFVATLSFSELIELAATIFSLEHTASIKGLNYITDEEISEMEETLEKMKNRTIDASDWYDLNQTFHGFLFRASGWPKMVKQIEDGRENLKRFQVDDELIWLNFDEFDAEHRAIFACVKKRNHRTTAIALKKHFDSSIKLLEGKFGG